ncbi:MAG: class I tRNA ligase family protein [Thermoplasmata archaeon]|nr:class I tRNA ligase family protein [Thermoplasmata archaeon]
METSREGHWQTRWASERIAEAHLDRSREKFYAVVAYPGPSGFLHIGHLRGLTLADSLHRYYRMAGRSVFFPTGTHASGLPAVVFARKVQEREPTVVAGLKELGVAEETWGELEEPEAAARFLGRSYLELYRRLGILIDESAYVTTVDPDYRAFIQWQFHRLHDGGHLVQAPYYASVCPVCGPISVDPSETDLSLGGNAEIVEYTAVPFPLEDGRTLLAATLRPETVYGVTNLWVHPTEPLSVWHHGDRLYLVSRSAAHRLVEQHGGRVGAEEPIASLFGRRASVPFGDREVPILPSPIVQPTIGTGVVMSVPAHAPADWVALQALSAEERSKVPPVVPEIIFFPPDQPLSESERALLAGDGPPAARAARATGAHSLADTAALEAATERLYRLELAKGRMLPVVVSTLPVPEARERMVTSFGAAGEVGVLREFSEPVICRQGHEVIIRRVPDQWFLHYGDAAWKTTTHELARSLRIVPTEYGRELPSVIDWYDDRPCIRRGRWLGTPFPLDPAWMIEPIADSTFYPAYYVVRPFVASGRLHVSQLTDPFFDYVFLGRGAGEPSVSRSLSEEIRAAFQYWYPLDLNIGGKEHKRVHFPVFLFTHAALLPRELWPKGLLVHWWLVATSGEKISKRHIGTKGGAIPPLQEALTNWGADALRLFQTISASPEQDFEWDPALVDQTRERLTTVERMVREAFQDGGGASPELDAWLEDAAHQLIAHARSSFESLDLRAAAQAVYITFPTTIRRYQTRGGSPGPTLQRIADAWVRLLSPITPHLAEELGDGRFSTLVAAAPFPSPEAFAESLPARHREEYLERLEEDLLSVIKPARDRGEGSEELLLYVAAPWKTEVEQWLEAAPPGQAPTVAEIMQRAGKHPELASARGEIAEYAARRIPKLRNDPPLPTPTFDEAAFLRASEGYLVRRFHVGRVAVYLEQAASEVDPMRRRQRARPGRPAFYFVGPPRR